MGKRGKGARGRESSIGLTGKSLRRTFRPPLSMWSTVKSKGRGGRLRGRGRRRGKGRKTGGGKHEWRKREQSTGGRSGGKGKKQKRGRESREREKERKELPIYITASTWNPKGIKEALDQQ